MTNPIKAKASNRRQSQRRKTRRFIKVQCRKGTMGLGPNLSMLVVDVSTTGLCLILSQALGIKTEVEVLIDGYGVGKPIKRKGDVRWQIEIASGHFITGVEFQKQIKYQDWCNVTAPHFRPGMVVAP